MAKVSPFQNDFSGGEFGGLTQLRTDIERYKKASAVCLNAVTPSQGAWIKRPGFRHVAEVKTSSKKTRLVPFEFSIEQAYQIEFGDAYFRFYKDHAQILDPVLPYEIVSPYAEADLFQLKFAQSADVLYIVHGTYAARKLSRTGHTSWTISAIDFVDGPYLDENTTATTLTPSATGPGAGITLTASAAAGINGGVGFLATDVGRLVRLLNGATWGYGKITARNSNVQVVVTVPAGFAFASVNPDARWRLGAFSDTTGYPTAVTFHEDRLVFAKDQSVYASNVGNYETFSPTNLDGSVPNNRSWNYDLNSEEVQVIRWIKSDEKALLAGTVRSEWVIRPSSNSEAITPSNVAAKESTVFGSADIQAVKVGRSVLFVQRSGKQVRELTFIFDVDGLEAGNLSLLAQHMAVDGIVEIAFSREPFPLLWAATTDGNLISLNYERDTESLRAGWNRHQVGGVSDAAENPAKVESVSVIPSPDGSYYELWVVVKRRINGSTKRYVEVMEKFDDETVDLKDSFFVDSGSTYDEPKTITNITKGAVTTVFSTAHGFVDGDKILISDVEGMSEVNTNSYFVSNANANDFRIKDGSGNNIDSTAFGDYVSGGFAREYVSTISGLSHLEGETVAILADGATRPEQVVTAGEITFAADRKVTTAQIGLPYRAQGKQLRLEAGSVNGTSIGKSRRIHRVTLALYRTVGLSIGFGFDKLFPVIFRRPEDPTSRAVPLFTGLKIETTLGDSDYDSQFCWESSEPLPCTLLAIAPQMETQDAL